MLAVAAVANQLTTAGVASGPAAWPAPHVRASQSACGPDASCVAALHTSDSSSLSLPAGLQQCADSGPAAACASEMTASDAALGTPSLPKGQVPCASVHDKPVGLTPAACTDELLPPESTSVGDGAHQSPPVRPGDPKESLRAPGPARLALTADTPIVRSGKAVLLTATASAPVTGTSLAMEIFETRSQTLLAACARGSQCMVAFAAGSGEREFRAFVTQAAVSIPNEAIAVPSNTVKVGWLHIAIEADQTIVGPGRGVTLTATSTIDVRKSGRLLEIYDLTAGSRLTYCSRGTSCTTVMKISTDAAHEIVGFVTGQPEAVSDPVWVTWLGVSLSATSIGPKTGGTVYLKATTNADLTGTPWVVGIYDQEGRLVDHVCKRGTTCSVRAWMSGGTTPSYTAMIGALKTDSPSLVDRVMHAARVPATPALIDIQARSAAVQPNRLLWGLDSCKAMTGDPSGTELFATVARTLGTPDFWGRYLTQTVCPAISSAEIGIAARNHMGILPIYNDYNCSNVSSYATGHGYAARATAAAQRLGIPEGRLIVVDIEPPGAACPGAANIDSSFIEGWYDGIHQAGYIPGFYGNGTSGSAFASAWCSAVGKLPHLGTGSDLWSFEPSLIGGYSRSSAPDYAPHDTGCAGNIVAWQYLLGSNGPNVDVDQDEALSSLPLWYPS